MHQCINIEAGICVARCCHHGTQWSRMVYKISFLFFFIFQSWHNQYFWRKNIVKCYSINFMTPMCYTIKHSRHFITGVGAVSTRILAQTSCCCKNFQKAAAIFPPFFFLSWTSQCSAVQWVSLECVYACVMIPFKNEMMLHFYNLDGRCCILTFNFHSTFWNTYSCSFLILSIIYIKFIFIKNL